MSKPRNGDEGVGLKILATVLTRKLGCGEPTFVSGLGKSFHVSVSLGMDSGQWGRSILAWGSYVLLSLLASSS